MSERQYGSVTASEARSLVQSFDPFEVAHTSKTGRLLDDEGEQIDERQTVPWTWHLGPFGSWPVTMAEVEQAFAEHADKEWFYGRSFRLGPVVCWDRGWGFQAVAPNALDKN